MCLLYQGEKECSYYLKTGQCKFGITCKFHHPQPAGTSLPASAPQFYPPVQSPSVPMAEQYGGVSTSLRVARPPLLASSYVQGAYGPVLFSPGVVPFSGWNPYSVCYDCFLLGDIPKKICTSYAIICLLGVGTCKSRAISWCTTCSWSYFSIRSNSDIFFNACTCRALPILALTCWSFK